MAWTELRFGKHRGKTLPQVIFADADWFFWAYEKRVFKTTTNIREAQAVYERACSIRIPQTDDKPMVAEYFIHPPTGKFGRLQVVPRSRQKHEGSPTLRLAVIDLSVPRRIAPYDKTGYSLLVKQAKPIIFGNASARLTKKRCEEFFDDDDNFVLGGED